MNTTEALSGVQPRVRVPIYHHEGHLFGIAAALSVLFWVVLTLSTFGIVWVYMLFIYVFVLFAQSALISFLMGNAVRITAEQFPDLDARLVKCCHRLGIDTLPHAYLMSGHGLLNAFATRFLRRYYVILLSEVVDALDGDPDAINFYIGHELGHIDRKHIAHGWWMAPALVLPLLGTAYRRAQEYTCDQYGAACCANPASAAHALAVLAAGPQRWKQLNHDAFVAQCAQTGGFWMSVNELASDYPWLCKRMARLNNPSLSLPSRHPLAWVLAVFMPRMGPGGPLVSLMMLFATVGVLAAVAIPAYQQYQSKLQAATAFTYGAAATHGVKNHFETHGGLPTSLDELHLTEPLPAGAQADMDQNNGVLTLRLAQGETIRYTPSLNDERQVEWACATTLSVKAIPSSAVCESLGE